MTESLADAPATYRVVSEPSGSVYLALLAFAERHSSRFTLVWQRRLTFAAGAWAIKDALVPFQEKAMDTSEWPGTTLIGGTAIVRRYRFSPEATEVLAAAERLYAWRAPERPEDLACYGADGNWWLASVAHEGMACLRLERDELSLLRTEVPGLELIPLATT